MQGKDKSKPIALNIDATLKPYGSIKIDGSVAIEPLAAKLHVVTNKVDLSHSGCLFEEPFQRET
jgi:hypothetical protein